MQIIQAITVFLLACVKFFLAIPLAAQYDFTFWQTFLLSCTGGLVGVVFFVKFSESVLKLYFRFFPFKPNTKKKKGFIRAFAIKVARKYGLFGIALITPIFLSIPLGTFLALHFFPDKKKTLPILFASVFGWSFILTLIWI